MKPKSTPRASLLAIVRSETAPRPALIVNSGHVIYYSDGNSGPDSPNKGNFPAKDQSLSLKRGDFSPPPTQMSITDGHDTFHRDMQPPMQPQVDGGERFELVAWVSRQSLPAFPMTSAPPSHASSAVHQKNISRLEYLSESTKGEPNHA